MGFFRNIFGSKKDKNAKNAPNTLAEANGTPDYRTSAEKDNGEIAQKNEKQEVKKEPKTSTLTAQDIANITAKKNEHKKPEAQPQQPAPKNDEAVKAEGAPKKAESATKESNPAKVAVATKTAASKAPEKQPASAKKATVKDESKKDSTEKSAPKSKAKSADTNVETKKEVKSDTPAKKSSADNKKTTVTASAPAKDEKASDATEEITVTKSARTGKFEIKKSKDGRFVFNLYASNKVIVATSQVYSSSTSAMNGIKSVIANASIAPIEDQTLKNATTLPYPKWEVYLDKGDQYRFRLCASNGSCVVHSQGYTSKANCKKGIESIIKFASDAEITKVYLEKK